MNSGPTSDRSRPRPSLNLQANGETGLTPRALMRVAAETAQEHGLNFPPARLRLLISRFVREGLAEDDFATWVITHADPTDNTAVSNVKRTRGF